MGKYADQFKQAAEEKDKSEESDAARSAKRAAGAKDHKRLNVKLPPALHQEFKVETTKRGESMSDAITRFIREYVST